MWLLILLHLGLLIVLLVLLGIWGEELIVLLLLDLLVLQGGWELLELLPRVAVHAAAVVRCLIRLMVAWLVGNP